MNVIYNCIIVTSMLSAATLLGHSTAPAIWDTLELGSCLIAVSLAYLCSFLVKHKNICIGCSDGDVLLMNGSVPTIGQREGRIEICQNNIYGTVCDDFWDRLDGDVVCRQLNFTAGM